MNMGKDMSKIIQAIENEQLKKDIPDFKAGDSVVVQIKVKEGTRERLQAFEGVVIAIKNRGLNSSFTVRKVSHGEGVERTFQTHSPLIASITVKRRGDVRRAKLYYLRELSGRAARIKEKIIKKKVTEKVASKKPKKAAKKTTKAESAEVKPAESKPVEVKKDEAE